MDITIFYNDKLVAIIEFKSNNADAFNHGKDLFKLKNEPGESVLRYFVELYKRTDKKTLASICDKLNNAFCPIGANTDYIGYSLSHKNNYDKGVLMFYNKDSKEIITSSLPLPIH